MDKLNNWFYNQFKKYLCYLFCWLWLLLISILITILILCPSLLNSKKTSDDVDKTVLIFTFALFGFSLFRLYALFKVYYNDVLKKRVIIEICNNTGYNNLNDEQKIDRLDILISKNNSELNKLNELFIISNSNENIRNKTEALRNELYFELFRLIKGDGLTTYNYEIVFNETIIKFLEEPIDNNIYIDINEISENRINRITNMDNQNSCSICVSDFNENDDNSSMVNPLTNITVLLCGHIFHYNCINQWTDKNETQCPNCRQPIKYLVSTNTSIVNSLTNYP